MSAHMKTHPIKVPQCEIIVKIPGRKNMHSYIPATAIGSLETFLNKYSETDVIDWTVVAKESISKHKQAGMVLRGARYRESMSQKKLSELSGVSQDNISRIENGKRGVGETLAKKLAKPLKINYLLLLEDYTGFASELGS